MAASSSSVSSASTRSSSRRWQPRFLVYDGLDHLPLSALRVLQAEAYLPPPAPAGGRRGRLRSPGLDQGRGGAPPPICTGLTASTLLIAENSASAHAPPLRVNAEVQNHSWSFIYHGPR